MKRYNLESSQSDRINFDESIKQEAETLLETLPFDEGREDDAWLQDGEEYGLIAFDNFEIDLEQGTLTVDDLKEAKARYAAVFPLAVRAWQKEMMIDHLLEEMSSLEKGYVTAINVILGGTTDGLVYGPVVIDIVSLETDGDQVAYRQSDDATDQDWQLGRIEDAVEEALSAREQLKNTKKEIAEMAAQAEILTAL